MSPSIRRKLEALLERRQELSLLLADPDVFADAVRSAALGREYAQLQGVAEGMARFQEVEHQLAELAELARMGDVALAELVAEESRTLQQTLAALDASLALELVPKDARDEANLFLEIRAGTGGDEAALFAGDLLRMYLRYADRQRWSVEVLSSTAGEHGGYREVIARVEGQGAYARLKFESGTHRVQRVPATEAQGRIHTSACTVAILPELEEVGDVVINPADLKIDTFKASGAGGQHVNKTESAIRVLHVPSGLVVECQDERSQHKNRARAIALLRARLGEAELTRQTAAQAESRRLQVGSGDRSQRIRTYNFPQGRLTDHRINLTLYQLEDVLQGELDAVIEPLLAEHRADQLKSLLDT